MCIAIVNKESLLSESVFQNSFESNPDGCGMAWVQNYELKTLHSLTSWKVLYETYKQVRSLTEHPILLHFRIGTSGVRDERNLHPFMINEDIALIHNGMLSYLPIESDKSDTWHFVEFLKTLKNPLSLFDDKSIEFNSISAISTGSKLCILNRGGAYSIINESAGFWVGDTWYSNKSYEQCEFSYWKKYDWKSEYPEVSDMEDLGFIQADLKSWDSNLLDEDTALNAYISESTFKKMTYANKAMLVLSIGSALFTMDSTLTAQKAINSLMEITNSISLTDLYEALLAQSYEMYSYPEESL